MKSVFTLILSLITSSGAFAAFPATTCTKAKADTYKLEIIRKVSATLPNVVEQYTATQTRFPIQTPNSATHVYRLFASRDLPRAEYRAQIKKDSLIKLGYVCN